jgi:hypothetical protein
MNPAERAVLERTKKSYYANNWSRLLLNSLEYDAQFALCEHIKSTEDLYIWIGFVEPGQHDFVVQTNSFYVHSFVSMHRTNGLLKKLKPSIEPSRLFS